MFSHVSASGAPTPHSGVPKHNSSHKIFLLVLSFNIKARMETRDGLGVPTVCRDSFNNMKILSAVCRLSNLEGPSSGERKVTPSRRPCM